MPPRLSRAIDHVVIGIAGAFTMLFLPLLGIAALGIFDAVPSSAAAYSGFWRVHDVLVDEGFDAGSIRSAAADEASGLHIVPTDLVLVSPVSADS